MSIKELRACRLHCRRARARFLRVGELASVFMNIGKGKVPPGCLSAEPGIQVTRFTMPLEQSNWHYAAELCIL